MTTPYTYWSQVPEHLRTKTQLSDLDLPRIPGGNPADSIHTRGPHGRMDTFDLYDATASLPSPATARQLEAARVRQDLVMRRCAECGARPDYPPTNYKDTATNSWVRLCRACLHIARLQETQRLNAIARASAVAQAAALLAEDNAAVVHLTVITPPRGESGRAKRPVALVVDAVTPSGAPLALTPIRLARSRSPLVPADAVPETEALPALHEIFAGRDVVSWSVGALAPIEDAFAGNPNSDRPRTWVTLDAKVAIWRGELDPRTHRLIPSLDPGRADLMALLIRRMAADHKPAPWDTEAA